MFFLLRSAACIGVVFCMLPDSGGPGALHNLAADGGRLVVGEAHRYCTTNPDCLRAGTTVAAAALSAAVAPSRAGVAAGGKSRPQPKD